MRFSFFSKDFRGSAKRRTLAFFEVSLAFPKKQGLEGQGIEVTWKMSNFRISFFENKLPATASGKSHC